MSNLIPHQQNKKILGDFRARYILAGSFLAIGIGLFSAFVLAPSFAVLFITRPAAAAEASRAQQNKTETADLVRAQALIVQVAPMLSASSSISSAILRAIQSRPVGVQINSISYSADAGQSIILGGSANNRELLDQYRTNLQKEPTFSSVKLPVGELVSFKGGNFTITISGKF